MTIYKHVHHELVNDHITSLTFVSSCLTHIYGMPTNIRLFLSRRNTLQRSSKIQWRHFAVNTINKSCSKLV